MIYWFITGLFSVVWITVSAHCKKGQTPGEDSWMPDEITINDIVVYVCFIVLGTLGGVLTLGAAIVGAWNMYEIGEKVVWERKKVSHRKEW